jgi:cobalamin biosynthesis protein CobT
VSKKHQDITNIRHEPKKVMKGRVGVGDEDDTDEDEDEDEGTDNGEEDDEADAAADEHGDEEETMDGVEDGSEPRPGSDASACICWHATTKHKHTLDMKTAQAREKHLTRGESAHPP